MTVRPLGENATLETSSLLLTVSPTGFRLRAFHTRISP